MAIDSSIPGLPYKRIMPGSTTWPQQLNSIPNPPQELWCIGNTSLLNSHSVAIVGAREATDTGKKLALRLSHDLTAEEGYPIVSGLAAGIDAHAHSGTIAAEGFTIAVLVDIQLETITPAVHRRFARSIVECGGLLVSENKPGSTQGHDSAWWHEAFKARDRIITGLSFCTIPVQAKLKSGTAATINHARRQGRLVRAPIFDPRDTATNGELYAGIQAAIRPEEWFNPWTLEGMSRFICELGEARRATYARYPKVGVE